jgi:hypothetical protein
MIFAAKTVLYEECAVFEKYNFIIILRKKTNNYKF